MPCHNDSLPLESVTPYWEREREGEGEGGREVGRGKGGGRGRGDTVHVRYYHRVSVLLYFLVV